MILLEGSERERIHATGQMASGTVGAKPSASEVIEQRFSHDAAGGVRSAEEEHVVNHDWPDAGTSHRNSAVATANSATNARIRYLQHSDAQQVFAAGF